MWRRISRERDKTGVLSFDNIWISQKAQQEMEEWCTAPGKVLIAGGYAVLRRHEGLVVAVDALFAARACPGTGELLRIESPQWGTCQDIDINAMIELVRNNGNEEKDKEEKENPFVWEAVAAVVSAAEALGQSATALRGVAVQLWGARSFYTASPHDSDTPESTSANSGSTGANCESNRWRVSTEVVRRQKTGLGSSAALTVALVGVLLRWLFRERAEPRWVHHVSQWAHCRAQGKIGSGFDVSAAVYGTHRYVRFSPHWLSPLLERPSLEQVTAILQEPWDAQVATLPLPDGLHLILGDVQHGSDTRSLVRDILQWWDTDPSAPAVIEALVAANKALGEVWERLAEALGQPMGQELRQRCAALPASEWPAGPLRDFWLAGQAVRVAWQQLGTMAAVPVEPPPQTALLDGTAALAGVALAVVPGAGGWDAVAALTLSPAVVVDWWRSKGVTALPVAAYSGRLSFQRPSGLP